MLMDSDFKGPVNLGNPVEFTINELSKLIKNKINKNLEIDYMPLPEDDPSQRRPNISLAKDKLGWEPLIDIDKGLDLTIDYFREKIK